MEWLVLLFVMGFLVYVVSKKRSSIHNDQANGRDEFPVFQPVTQLASSQELSPSGWRDLRAPRLFFAKATNRGVFDLGYADYWDAKLGDSGTVVLRRFIAEGLIEPAPIETVIDKRFTIDQLKPHLKSRGLKVGGKKPEMVARIMAADPVWAQEQTKGLELYRRTSEGQRLADEIYDSISAKQGEMEARLTMLIHDGRHEEAHRAWAEWDAEQVFPRDAWLGVDNRKIDPSHFIQMAQSL
jgi:hypothetical protein